MFLYVEMSKTDDLEALLQGNPFLLNSSDDNGRTALHKVELKRRRFSMCFLGS